MQIKPVGIPQEDLDKPASWEPSKTFLRYSIWTMLVGSGLYLLVLAASASIPDPGVRAIGPAMLSAVALGCWYLIEHGRISQAFSLMVFGGWVSITFVAILNGGVNAPIYHAFPLVILAMGWLVNERITWAFAGLTSAVTLALIYAQTRNWLPGFTPAPALLTAIVMVFIYMLAAALIIFLVRAYKRRLADVQQVSENLKTYNAILEQSERKFSTAFRSSPVSASIATASEGRIIDVNDNFERDFGWKRSDLVGKTSMEVGLWTDPQVRREWIDVLIRDGRIVNYETVWMHKNGERRDISISGEIINLDGSACILSHTTDITARKAAERQIENLAFFDPLTGLANRRYLRSRLEQALAASTRHKRKGALLFIDLDNFKTINDTHGHDKGDLLLQLVAERLKHCIRDGDTVARLGGDEFLVMLEHLSEDAVEAATQAEAVGEKILVAMNQNYLVADVSHHSTASIGITLFGDQAEGLDEPLRRADLAMYQAKSAGRNAIRFFDPAMQAAVSGRAALEQELRSALAQRELLLYYQPQVDRHGMPTGAEALVRWQHPTRGTVSPTTFIPLAEETGLIVQLGAQVLELACGELARWARDPALSALTIAVNVSPHQFNQKDFVAQVLAAIERTGADPSRLKLELTESLFVLNLDDVVAKMSTLKNFGIRFSLDDFGTGYSSLAYLKRLPLDQLKIDQSFVRDILLDMNDAAIAKMVIVLAETLGLTVIAEGVETTAQRDALFLQGCHAYQGYLFSRPLPCEEFETLVKQQWAN
jgi:diguanylate cyclase (GGDEF)-like protein/PAS domain S-box-containing protein